MKKVSYVMWVYVTRIHSDVGQGFKDLKDSKQDSTQHFIYRQIFDIRRTKSQDLNVSRLVLRLSLPNPLKPRVKSRMKM